MSHLFTSLLEDAVVSPPGNLPLTDAVAIGAEVEDPVRLLGERDPEWVVASLRRLGPGALGTYRSFGTCSITEPAEELGALGPLATTLTEDIS